MPLLEICLSQTMQVSKPRKNTSVLLQTATLDRLSSYTVFCCFFNKKKKKKTFVIRKRFAVSKQRLAVAYCPRTFLRDRVTSGPNNCVQSVINYLQRAD